MSAAAERVDAVCIGTGQAVPALATSLARLGESVVVLERGLVGGSCVNVGCTPTKTLRKSARVAHLARRAGDFGVHVGEVRVDVAAAMARMRAVVEGSRTGLEGWLVGTPGLELVRRDARLAGREGDRIVVRAGDRTWHAARVYLNTGTRPSLPPIPGLATARPLTNEGILALTEAPRQLVVIGGSYIGLEFAQIFRRLGSEVTVLETAPAIAAREDADISARLTRMLEDEGIVVRAGVRIEQVAREADGTVRVALAGEAAPVTGTALLVATGRAPTPTASGSRASASRSTRRATCRWTITCRRRPASGRWATSTGAVPSRTPPGRITRSSSPTTPAVCARRRGASPPTRCTPIRRSAASA